MTRELYKCKRNKFYRYIVHYRDGHYATALVQSEIPPTDHDITCDTMLLEWVSRNSCTRLRRTTKENVRTIRRIERFLYAWIG